MKSFASEDQNKQGNAKLMEIPSKVSQWSFLQCDEALGYLELTSTSPYKDESVVKLEHGSAGRLYEELIQKSFLQYLQSPYLREKEDAAIAFLRKKPFALATNSYVVKPSIFPGGDIGSLSVHCTVNNLCMRGASPAYLAASFVLEEGMYLDKLQKIVRSVQKACLECGVEIIAADTKIVKKGVVDEILITTTGIGILLDDNFPSVRKAKDDDVVILSGDIGRHGMAILAAREGLEPEETLKSDSAPLHKMVKALKELGAQLHVLRDITSGGIAAVLNEIAQESSVGIEINEAVLSICSEVKSVCASFGLDPLYVQCQGRLVAVVESGVADKAIVLMKQSDYGKGAHKIGVVVNEHRGSVIMHTLAGGRNIIDKFDSGLLSRIC